MDKIFSCFQKQAKCPLGKTFFPCTATKKDARPDVKFCVSVFRQSQEWRWKTGRILAWIP